MVSTGRRCKLIHSGILCSLGKNGEPSIRSKACDKCGELRCKTHCKCGRQGTATGRNAPRLSALAAPKAIAKAAPAPQPKAKAKAASAPQLKAKAQARPDADAQAQLGEPDIHADGEWFDNFLGKLGSTSEVYASAMIIDDPQFCNGLAAELRKTRGFKLTLVVDRQHYNNETSRCQGECLARLKKLGAEVFLGTGHSGTRIYGNAAWTGLMHRKAVVLDSNLCFMGGSNFTKSSRKSREIMAEFTGNAALKVLALIVEAKNTAPEKL